MGKTRVGIIFGGKSAEHEVSLQSAKNIVDAIDKEKYEVVLIGINQEGYWYLHEQSSYLLNKEDPKLIQLNQSDQPVSLHLGSPEYEGSCEGPFEDPFTQVDVVFPIVHGTIGEDGSLQGMMRVANLPFVGTDVLGSSLCMDKDVAKKLLSVAGINVAKGITVTRREKDDLLFEEVVEELGKPLFIKPANQGSSVGVSKVTTETEFYAGIEDAFHYDHKLVIEETMVGREIEVSVLGNEDPIASMPGEILPQTEFYSYESKYIDEKGADLAIPAELSEDLIENVKQVAIDAFRALQCEGLARVDFFLTEDAEIYVNEINTLPGFTQISMYPKLWEVSGISYPELINRLIELSMSRHERDQKLKSSVWE